MELNASLAFVNATCCALHVFNYNGIVSIESNGEESADANERERQVRCKHQENN